MSLNTHLYILWNAEHSWSGSQHETSGCKAGNKLCSSLIEPGKPPSGTMFCDICCSEPGFCRSCCCILCSMTVDPANESYSFIRCEATVENKTTCGHLAHLDCGLKSHMAGTVGGHVCLDVEYYCRRCDTRTDLLPHVKKFLKICESIESIDDINKILKLGVSVLHGSRRSEAKRLLYIFELAMGKVSNSSVHGSKVGLHLKMFGMHADNISVVTQAGMACNINENHALKVDEEYVDMGLGSPKKVSENFDPVVESIKFDHHVDQTLQAFKKTQEWENCILFVGANMFTLIFIFRHTNPRIILLALRVIGNYVRWGTHDQIQHWSISVIGMPDGVLINGKGPYRYNDSLVPDGIDYLTIDVHPGNGCTLLVDFAVSFESFENRLLALCVSVRSIMPVPLAPYPSPPAPFTPSANGSLLISSNLFTINGSCT
ncbi:hypothetical protein POM88_025415 [Heracleum sosnowskyi]|uniref:Oberon-like PHD finger domain-containing protein n=1 Tax=Heracleum sosnowskyi TaxID=360622 RepID=A0AAD8I4Z2_9APIA|nr:hypothetical protein POM88_025415 [Heracleum sosnowskyi]